MKNKFDVTLLVLIIIAAIIFSIFVYANYGGKPITEIPSWAVPFFLGR